MAKNYTFPILFDEIKSLSITDLKKLKYLQKNLSFNGNVYWKSRGESTGSISINTSLINDNNFVEFIYTCNDKSYNYKVDLVSIKSNLNNADIWYFKCKFTGIRCRKLHLINGRFQHRSILKTGMYSSQTRSKYYRSLEKVYGAYFESDNHYSELYSKHFKKYYNGKPTKKYLKLLEQINKAESIDKSDIESLLLSK
ncbi:hypothetical protein BW723_08390 [Polaribacter reichenbachii]|uniref:Uncharacterized protein n=1 Tax=Polaribacter reichenbachii TaxID=996801 RepID=A0A1B8U6R0_9FLAO|nr:hypothetical protein [Polaribacter reichenbachii]APZ46314.1 hypothetical protein BW723_08390 [Polaribacter reichenbachii]AUC20177.1 hypothetical protein BTO17_16410 [Polaribacter reichenbachii]OBY67564.1 hypothetical protein LPB301_01100 [Polaribacter reichenbachii]